MAVIKRYRCFWRESGNPALDKDSTLLRGAIAAILVSGSVFMVGLGLTWAIDISSGINNFRTAYVLSSVVFALSFVIIPYVFVGFANLPGGIKSFPEDLPLTPIWWGFLVGGYGALAILRSYQIGHWKTFSSVLNSIPIIGEWSILGLPILGFLVIRILTINLLSYGRKPGWRSVGIFHVSWTVGLIQCLALGTYLTYL